MSPLPLIEPQWNGRFSGSRLWDQYQLQLPHEDREGWQLRVNSISKSDFCSMLEEKCGRPKQHAKINGVSARQGFQHWSSMSSEQIRAGAALAALPSPVLECWHLSSHATPHEHVPHVRPLPLCINAAEEPKTV